jgi:cbb3-type cytochrome oxidase cytochrome c subunit
MRGASQLNGLSFSLLNENTKKTALVSKFNVGIYSIIYVMRTISITYKNGVSAPPRRQLLLAMKARNIRIVQGCRTIHARTLRYDEPDRSFGAAAVVPRNVFGRNSARRE